MNKSFISYIFLFVILVLVQVLLLNHIVLFNSAVCLIFIYFLVKLPINLSPNILLTLGFFLGLTVDMLSDTPGLNALCCTILSSLKKPVFYAYEQHDDKMRNIIPSISTMGLMNFSKYTFSLSAIYCLLAFFVEFVNFTDIVQILIKAGGSTLFTFFLILALDSLIYKN